ncbi:MAG: DinB family protein [Phycisphaerales bacterium]
MGAPESDQIAATLLVLLDNQLARARAALERLPQEVFEATQAGGCNSIREIGAHLLDLQRGQLLMLGSARRENVPAREVGTTPAELLAALETGLAEVRAAILEHDASDWFRQTDEPRPGKWGDEPTLHRLVRPLNDFVNHLGAIRALRRQQGSGAERTQ